MIKAGKEFSKPLFGENNKPIPAVYPGIFDMFQRLYHIKPFLLGIERSPRLQVV
jgi:hypothetical protein